MTKPNTSIELKGIASVLRDNRLKVPTHQRPFEWTRDEVKELLADIGSAYDTTAAEYFLGSIVVIASDTPRLHNVLDGQQRLATISLLLAGVADAFLELGDSARSNAVRQYLVSFDIASGSEHPHLGLSAVDDTYFQALISPGFSKPAMGSPESLARLYDARVTTRSWLSTTLTGQSNPIDWLSRLFEYLRDAVQVIYFAVPDDSNAYAIFETLNDRGLDLSIADLLKNYLLGRAAAGDAGSILHLWNKTLTILNAHRSGKIFTDFLRHLWSSTYDVVREKDLYRSIKSRIKTPADVKTFATTLDKESYYYSALLSPDHELWTSAAVRESLGILAALGLEQYRPFLLAAVPRFEAKASNVEALLTLLISWNVRLLIVGGGGGGVMERNYAELGREVRQGKLRTVRDIAKRAVKFVPADRVFQEAFAVARVSNAGLARYYLRELERQAAGRESELVPAADLTLEHVLPERPGTNWPQFDEEQKKAYTKRLGNMVLLTQRLNNRLKSAPYKTKQAEFKKSKLPLTLEVAKQADWNPAAIEACQRKLAQLAVKAWPLK